MENETTIPQEQETARMVESEFNHDYDLIRAYAEQMNGEVEIGKESPLDLGMSDI